MNPQTHNRGAGRSRLVEEIEEMLRRRLSWNEIMMSNIMWRYIGINVDELITYGIDPHAWIEILRHLSINDTYMLGAAHGDVYVRPTSPSWYEVSAHTTSTTGVMYFERLTRTIKTPTVEFATWRKKPNVIYVKFYFKIRKSEWPWHGKGYEIIKSFNATELLKYVAGLIDTDGIVASEKQPYGYRFEIDITSANIEFLEFLKNMVYERLGITGSIKKSKGDSRLRFRSLQAVQLYEGLQQYLAHPMKRLRAEVYLKYYNKELTIREFEHFYEPLKYDNDGNDPKRYHAADMLTQAAPQTHTHGEASPVKSPRLAIKNRVKTYMKTRTKKLKACDAQ
jgi:hypothetical protein